MQAPPIGPEQTGSRRDRLIEAAVTRAEIGHANLLGATVERNARGAVKLELEDCSAPPLGSVLTARGPLSLREALSIVRDLAAAADALSRHGLMAREFTPDRILVDRKRGAILADYGFPPDLIPSSEDPDGRARAYRSPEERCGDPVDSRSTVYSLGAILLTALTAQPAPDVLPERFVRDDDEDSPTLEGVIARAMAADPLDRYEDPSSFVRTAAVAIQAREELLSGRTNGTRETTRVRVPAISRLRAQVDLKKPDGEVAEAADEAARRAEEQAIRDAQAAKRAEEARRAAERAEQEDADAERRATEAAEAERRRANEAEAARRAEEKAAQEAAEAERARQATVATQAVEAERARHAAIAAQAAEAERAEQAKVAKEAAEAERRADEKAAKEAAEAERRADEKAAKEAAEAERRRAKEAEAARRADEKAAKQAAEAERARQAKVAKEAAEAERRTKAQEERQAKAAAAAELARRAEAEKRVKEEERARKAEEERQAKAAAAAERARKAEEKAQAQRAKEEARARKADEQRKAKLAAAEERAQKDERERKSKIAVAEERAQKAERERKAKEAASAERARKAAEAKRAKEERRAAKKATRRRGATHEKDTATSTNGHGPPKHVSASEPRQRATGNKSRTARRLVVAAVILGAAAGTALASTSGGDEQKPATVSSDALSLQLPTGWDETKARDLGFGSLSNAVAGARSGQRGVGIVAGISDKPELARTALADAGAGRAATRLGDLHAWRYKGLEAGPGLVGTAYVAYTSAGQLLIVCHAPAGQAARALASCENAASTVSLKGGARALPLSTADSAKRELDKTLAALGKRRETGRKAFAEAPIARKQAAAARSLERAFNTAAERVAQISTPPGAVSYGALADALYKTAGAYGGIARATAKGDAPGYDRARQAILDAEARVRDELARATSG